MSDLELLQRVLRSSLGGRSLTDESTWRWLAAHRCEGDSNGAYFRCGADGVVIRQNGVQRLVPWASLAQPSIFDALEAMTE